MPLSGAVRTQRYRDRLKQNRPDELERQKKQNAAKVKSKKKKISELTLEEADISREKWRKQKRKSRKTAKEINVEFEDEVDIKEEFLDINDDEIYEMPAEDFVADMKAIAANSKEINGEFKDEVDIKEELIDINHDETCEMPADDFLADMKAIGNTDTTDPIKTVDLQEVGLRRCLENSENQTNTTKHILLKDFEADDIELSNKTSKGIPEDPDVLFLYSLLPDIKEMSKDQKRQFKIGVLQLTNDILQEK